MRTVLIWVAVLSCGLTYSRTASAAGCFGDTLKRAAIAKMHDFSVCGDRDLEEASKIVPLWLTQDLAGMEKVKDDTAAEAWLVAQYAALKGSLALMLAEIQARKR